MRIDIIPDARSLARHLWRGVPGSWGYLWHVRDDEKKTIWIDPDHIPEYVDIPDGAHCYFCVNPSTRREGRSTNTSVTAINTLFCEYDGTHTREDIEALDVPPSLIFESSPGKQHCYWLLRETVILDTPQRRAEVARIQKAWVARMRGDPAAKDLARVLRLPGSYNVKPQYQRADGSFPQVTRIGGDESLYDFDHLARLVPAEPTPAEPTPERSALRVTPPRQRVAAAAGVPRYALDPHDAYAEQAVATMLAEVAAAAEGSRNDTLFRNTIKIAQLQHRLNDSIWRALQEAAVQAGLDDREAAETIRSGQHADHAQVPNDTGLPRQRRQRTRRRAGGAVPASPDPADHYAGLAGRYAALGGAFRFNQVTRRIEMNGLPMTDRDLSHIVLCYRQEYGAASRETIGDHINVLAERSAYHPIQQTFEAVPFAGGDPIADLAACLIPAADRPITYADGTTRSYAHAMLRRWLVGAVARAYSGTQNVVLALTGAQGMGKSTFVQWLASPFGGYHAAGTLDPDSKDALVGIAEKFVWELSELDGLTRRHDAARLKAILTLETITARRPYARNAETQQPLANWIATSNEAELLSDSTGNRRWAVIELAGINFTYATIDPAQVWAQAFALWRAGERGVLTPEERAAQGEGNAEHQQGSIIGDALLAFFEPHPTAAQVFTGYDILRVLNRGDGDGDGKPPVTFASTQASLEAIKAALRLWGVHSSVHRANGVRVRGYRGLRLRTSAVAPEPDDGAQVFTAFTTCSQPNNREVVNADTASECETAQVFTAFTAKREQNIETHSTTHTHGGGAEFSDVYSESCCERCEHPTNCAPECEKTVHNPRCEQAVNTCEQAVTMPTAQPPNPPTAQPTAALAERLCAVAREALPDTGRVSSGDLTTHIQRGDWDQAKDLVAAARALRKITPAAAKDLRVGIEYLAAHQPPAAGAPSPAPAAAPAHTAADRLCALAMQTLPASGVGSARAFIDHIQRGEYDAAWCVASDALGDQRITPAQCEKLRTGIRSLELLDARAAAA